MSQRSVFFSLSLFCIFEYPVSTLTAGGLQYREMCSVSGMKLQSRGLVAYHTTTTPAIEEQTGSNTTTTVDTVTVHSQRAMISRTFATLLKFSDFYYEWIMRIFREKVRKYQIQDKSRTELNLGHVAEINDCPGSRLNKFGEDANSRGLSVSCHWSSSQVL